MRLTPCNIFVSGGGLMFSRLLRQASIVALASILAPAALAQEATYNFDIPSQSLSDALRAYAQTTGEQLIFSDAQIGARQSAPISGQLTSTAALARLLDGTGLTHTRRASGVVVIQDPNSPTQLGDATGAPPSGDSEADLVVTGTRIRGVADQFSPIHRVDRDDMDLAGAATVFDAIQTLPQNFGGGPSPDTSRAGATSGAGAAGVNLRGLGSEATLVLLNGRRLAPGGGTGGFVDISTLPVTAIERIEVLPDGASAIYGSDAIAGVVNIITRDDFQGAETRVGFSSAAGGGAETLQIGQSAGWAAQGRHLMLSYQYTSANELDQRDRDFARGALPDPNYLLPFTQTNSAFASGGFELNDRASISGDAYYSERFSKTVRGDDYGFPVITRQAVDVQQYGFAASLDLDLGSDWRSVTTGSYSYSHHEGAYEQSGFINTDDAATSVAALDTSIGGPLFELAAGDPVRAALGLHYREESADIISLGLPSGLINFAADKSRGVGSAFAELYAPIIGDADAVPGIHRLAVSAAVRHDDYSDLGASTTPRFGLLYAPTSDLALRATWGTAFRAPRLEQMRDQVFSFLGIYEDPTLPGGQAVALVMGGQKADLDPEQAEALTFGFDWTPHQFDAFRLRATYFHIDYSERVGYPSLSSNSAFHFVNFTGPVELNPDPASISEIVSRSTSFFNYADFFPIGPLAVGDVTALLDYRSQNLSASRVEGIDLEATLALQDWSLFANVTWLDNYSQQVTPSSPTQSLLNTYGNPIGLRVRSGVQWSSEALTASLTANYADNYTDDKSIAPNFDIDAWLTFDAGLRLDLGDVFDSAPVARGVTLSLTVNNLLDEDPPSIGPRAVGDVLNYDPANADPMGRRIGVLVTKQW